MHAGAANMSARSMSTGGRGESGFFHAVVETARIVDVNVSDYTVSAVGEFGNRRFFDIQVMSPYFHYFNGEGWYAQPEIGALCWVCQESTGLHAKHFVLGYQAPHDQRVLVNPDVDPNLSEEAQQILGESSVEADNFKANRQTLNPGDQMWRGRDENFVILRRGGVVQIGAGPATQRMYIPLGGIIRDSCFGYELDCLAGDMRFTNDSVQVQGTELTQADDAGNVKTRFRIRAKTIANEKEHAVILTFGSHEEDEDLRLSLQVKSSGAAGAPLVADLQIDREGTVSWQVSGEFILNTDEDMFLTSQKNVQLTAVEEMRILRSNFVEDVSRADMTLQAAGHTQMRGANVTLSSTAGNKINLDGTTQVGGAGGEPLILGSQLVAFLQQLIEGLTNPLKPFGVAMPPGFPQVFPGMASLAALLPTLLSSNTTT